MCLFFRALLCLVVVLSLSERVFADQTSDIYERILKHPFDLPEPQQKGERVNLWSTHYYVFWLNPASQGIPMLTKSGNELGVKLTPKDWCGAAVEGTQATIQNNKIIQTYNHDGTVSASLVDCRPFYPGKPWAAALGRSRFKKTVSPYGDGSKANILVPFRTIAADPKWEFAPGKYLTHGNIVYIPAARGVKIKSFDGRELVHDGYFFVGDVGGAVKKNHIDIFIGANRSNPFKALENRGVRGFEAFVINSPELAKAFGELHKF